MNIELPWPPKECSPNARAHYLAKSRVTKAYREQAYWLAQSRANYEKAAVVLGCRPIDPAAVTGTHLLPRALRPDYSDAIILSIVFHPPDKRKRDLDNMLSSIKAGLDGIADALSVNDQRFEFNIKRGDPVKSGSVVITIS